MNYKWQQRFLELAKTVSGWSKDPSSRIGAVIVRPDKTVASLGYNGFPRGCDDSPELYDDRNEKYGRVIHAEMNAILHAQESLKGYTIYVYSPVGGPTCDRCAAHIIQAGITEVVYTDYTPNPRWKEALDRATNLYDESDVKVTPFD